MIQSLDTIVKHPKIFLYAVLTYMLKNDGNLILPEIFYVFDINNAIKFLKLFGGRRIYVPTADELFNSIKEILVAYLKIVENKTEEEIKTMLDLNGYQLRYINTRIEQWEQFLQESNYLTIEDLKKFENLYKATMETTNV